MNYNSICLFSSAGIGELGIKANNIRIVASNEINEKRHELYKINYQTSECFTGDIWEKKDDIIQFYKQNYPEDLFLLYATPPCQGMSLNGIGKLLSEIKRGNRNERDERNRLIIPTMDIITALNPKWVLLENVPNMRNTLIHDENDNLVNIISYIEMRLGSEYKGTAEVVNTAEYGIPQIRNRLITIFTRDVNGKRYYEENGTFFPVNEKLARKEWVTLSQAIGDLPPLDGKKESNARKDFHPLHYCHLLKEDKYWWVSNTKEGDTAYNNQCVNEACGYDKNPLHGNVRVDGVLQSKKDLPIYCEKCGSLLPRPSMIDKKTGDLRLIKGYVSAYKRMEWDSPASTITQNFVYEASDNNIHPSQNRVLSMYEALLIQSVADYEYNFQVNRKYISSNMLAEIIGESVPPKLIDIICKKIIAVEKGKISCDENYSHQLCMFELPISNVNLEEDKKKEAII